MDKVVPPGRRAGVAGARTPEGRVDRRRIAFVHSSMSKLDKLAAGSAVLGRIAFHAMMWSGLWLMLSASASYLELGDTHPFFLEKWPLAHPSWWLAALYIHVPSALFSLPACLVLLLGSVRRRFPRFHRWLGRVTGAVIVLAMVPSGMYLALFARGGWISTSGFWLTGAITFVAMVKSIQAARAGDMRRHRRFSAHVMAQLSVAVVSRALLVAADAAELDGTWVYVAALWVPVLGNALVAELWTRPRSARSRASGWFAGWTGRGARTSRTLARTMVGDGEGRV
jgi:uncharacterized membrane protein